MGSYAPNVECPECGAEFTEDAYFEMGEGSELECPKCGAELSVSEVEMVMHWTVTTKAQYDADQAKLKACRDAQLARFLEMVEERRRKGLLA